MLSRSETKVVILAAVIFASLTYRVVDQIWAKLPVAKNLVDVADDKGCPSTLGWAVHVVVFAAAVKWVLPRL